MPNRDVRMRGFRSRADVEEVERFLAAGIGPLGEETVPLALCVGRVLGREVRASCDVPGYARAAMDGYAVRGEETFGASLSDPIELVLRGDSFPGRGSDAEVEPGTAVRVATGAPVPRGADAVIMAEGAEERAGRVFLSEAVPPGKHVGERGEDIRRGEVALPAGRRIRPQDAGLLASIGVAEVPCVRRPRVALLITGDELLPPGSRPAGYRIVDSNSVVLSALVRRDGGEVLRTELLPDRPERIRRALEADDVDSILVSGGSSVGPEDHAPRLVAELGSLDYHGIAMRPSSPSGVGRVGPRPVFLLPGNPVSCLCAYEFFAGPTLRALGGRSRAWPHRSRRLPLARKIASALGRTDYVRVAIEAGHAVPLAISGASILSSTVRAAGAVVVPRSLEGLPEGAEVEVLLYDDEISDDDPGEGSIP